MTSIFNLCETPTSSAEINNITNTMVSSLQQMTMIDYPYPTSFLEPVPAWPVTVACENAKAAFDAKVGDEY